MTCPGMAVIPAIIASEIAVPELTMGEEALPIYTKEDLQKTLNDIKNKLDAEFPVTTELIFLENVRNELKGQLAEIETAAEEIKTTVPIIDMTEFEIDLEEKLDNARRLIYELDNIIINPSIDQIDSVLKLIEILDPEVQGEILATKPELPNRTVDTKANVFKARPVKATGAPVIEFSLFLLPFAAIAGIFGVLLLLVALVAYIKLFQSFTPLSFNRRRRKRECVYAYA